MICLDCAVPISYACLPVQAKAKQTKPEACDIDCTWAFVPWAGHDESLSDTTLRFTSLRGASLVYSGGGGVYWRAVSPSLPSCVTAEETLPKKSLPGVAEDLHGSRFDCTLERHASLVVSEACGELVSNISYVYVPIKCSIGSSQASGIVS